MAQQEHTLIGEFLFSYKGAVFPKLNYKHGIPGALKYLDSLESYQIRDDDIFIVTFPKSGTIWMQYIVSILYEDVLPEIADQATYLRVPWVEYFEDEWSTRPSPRLFCSHLKEHMVPQGLQRKRGKVGGTQTLQAKTNATMSLVIYVMRNPKDVLVSYFHFTKMTRTLENVRNLDEMLENFMSGRMLGGCWFDHIKGWFDNKDKYNILFVSYEDMIMNLRSVILNVSKFVGKSLSDMDLDKIIDRVSFKNMKNDSIANYEIPILGDILDLSKNTFMRKGTIGDWKNCLTVAQSEHFDQVYQERMGNLPLHFIWDINDLHE